ncbi:hypothetical protein QBC34DRAFT_384272 [Podospora aff. communis PSN243]|uniref:F-box domain-containing protein n=1 Tax=Podospora aff. communis PSN243 TaxID=3040156 RepID=A0AAV9GBA9_9PEZI|nr:hypothetical protein QBC34DRAFT_384272 [Podospora aff. communis PSN243]
MAPDTVPRTFFTLPGEIRNAITAELSAWDLLILRATSRDFRALIPPLNMHELILAEGELPAVENALYACSLCLRLRRFHQFADTMLTKKRRRGLITAVGRFCVDCGLANMNTKAGGYSAGTFITRKGVTSVICVSCGCLAPHAFQQVPGVFSQFCSKCFEPGLEPDMDLKWPPYRARQ